MHQKTMEVLLVEDNPGDARLLREMFNEPVSYSVKLTHVESMNGAERHVAEHKVDVIVLDLGLPDAHGLGALRRARAAASHIPLVVLTGLDDEALALSALQEGAQDYLVKGQIETHGLKRALRYAVERKIMEVNINNDVIGLQRAEAELRESTLVLRLALDVSDQGVWCWDLGQGTDSWKWDVRCKSLFGLESDTSVNYALWANAIPAEDRTAAEEGIARALDPANTLDDYVSEYRVVHPDGSVAWVAATGRALFEPDPTEKTGRRAVRILGTIRDVSQVKRAEHEREGHQFELEKSNDELGRLSHQLVEARNVAERANRAKSHFLAGMSHELRTPLTGILGYTRLLRMEGGLNATQAGRVEAMLEAGKHLLEIITRVLDLSEIEAGHVELLAAKIDVQAVAAACLDLVRPAAEAKGLTLNITVAPGTRRELVADPTRLRQVLLNLLGNAVKFTTVGAIELRLYPTSDGSILRVEVADTGPGIPAKQRQHLFQDFERLDAAATVEGAGLGLAISARLMALLGGRLGHDNNPDGGSVFWLELPLDTVVRSQPTRPPASDGASLGLVTLHVLVVDDVLMNREIAASFLRAAGHTVTCVEGGAEAVAAVAMTDFDVILMDVRMPEMDGLEATRRIRAIEGTRRRVPIVALTAQAFTEQVAECRKAGMDSHLSKPFDPDQLLATIVQATITRPAYGESVSLMPMTTVPAALTIPVMGAELLVLDQKTFDRTAFFLAPDAVASYLRTIAESGKRLLDGLREADALIGGSDKLAEAAHTLVGSAGMFGFERVAALARRFERAVQSAPAEVPALTEGLCAALEITLEALQICTSVRPGA